MSVILGKCEKTAVQNSFNFRWRPSITEWVCDAFPFKALKRGGCYRKFFFQCSDHDGARQDLAIPRVIGLQHA